MDIRHRDLLTIDLLHYRQDAGQQKIDVKRCLFMKERGLEDEKKIFHICRNFSSIQYCTIS